MSAVDLTKCQRGDMLALRDGQSALLTFGPNANGWCRYVTVDGDAVSVDAATGQWSRQYESKHDVIAIAHPTRAELEEQRRELLDALAKIRDCDDAPIIDPSGDVEFGLHCGVEDRQCEDRYEGANYGYAQGSEKTREWACNIASSAIARVEATNG